MTVIKKAKELIKEIGHEKAIEYFTKKVSIIGEPKSFLDLCNKSGWLVAIDFIKNDLKSIK